MLAPPALLLESVDTKAGFRLQVLRMVGLGFTQKAIGTWIGLSEYQMSRWLNDDPAVRIDTDAFDAWRKLLSVLKAEVTRDVTLVTTEEHQRLMADHAITKAGQTATGNVRKEVQRRQRFNKSSQRGKKLAKR